MKDSQCVEFLQWALPRLRMRWPGFRKVRRQVCKRVDRRLKELALDDVAAYRSYLELHSSEWTVLDTLCRISISRFYRDRGVFDYLRDEILPALAESAQETDDHCLRCWSVGCASGEEPYTLNIIWQLRLSSDYPEVTLRVTATDSDANMLTRAQRGSYPASSLKDLPIEWREAAFSTSDDLFDLKPEFRAAVEFVEQDIRDDMPTGGFHLILCRHLAFTYFDESLQREILQRVASKLVPGGILVAGKQEPLPVGDDELEECRPNTGVYRKRVGDQQERCH